MLFFAELPVLIVPTAVLLVITVGRVYTVIAERITDHSQHSDSDHQHTHVRHA